MECKHVKGLDRNIKPNTPKGCEECLKEHMTWVHLRLCLTCGHVGCCDSSIGKHATKHYNDTRHPVMTEYPSKEWVWCYVDNDYAD